MFDEYIAQWIASCFTVLIALFGALFLQRRRRRLDPPCPNPAHPRATAPTARFRVVNCGQTVARIECAIVRHLYTFQYTRSTSPYSSVYLAVQFFRRRILRRHLRGRSGRSSACFGKGTGLRLNRGKPVVVERSALRLPRDVSKRATAVKGLLATAPPHALHPLRR